MLVSYFLCLASAACCVSSCVAVEGLCCVRCMRFSCGILLRCVLRVNTFGGVLSVRVPGGYFEGALRYGTST